MQFLYNNKVNCCSKTPWLLLIFSIRGILGHKIQWGPCLVHFLEPCRGDNIQFYLFTSDRSRNQSPVVLEVDSPEPPSWINMSHPMKVIIHGYGGFVDYNATRMIRTAYLDTHKDLNILVVDWGKLARLPCYPSAVINTRQAGECTASLLTNLYKRERLRATDPVARIFQLKDLHVIGFSLGAHVAGFASNSVEDSVGQKFRRITALDPALPFFATPLKDWKLDKTDARFVDVIHTNGGVFGKLENCGHIDFYVNGGLLQPHCMEDKNQPLCSHMSAPGYFAESISSELGFWGIRCENYFDFVIGRCGEIELDDDVDEGEDSEDGSLFRHMWRRIDRLPVDDHQMGSVRPEKLQWQLMGAHCNESSTGIYAVRTKRNYPFAMGLVWT